MVYLPLISNPVARDLIVTSSHRTSESQHDWDEDDGLTKESHRFAVQCFRLKTSPDDEVKRRLHSMARTKELSLPNKRMKLQHWVSLFNVLSDSESLEVLDLSYTNLQSKSLKSLANLLLSGNSHVIRLDLSGIDFHTKGCDVIHYIGADCYLENLGLRGCKLQDKDLDKIFSLPDGLSQPRNKTLTTLNLSSNNIESKGNIIRKLIHHFKVLSVLDLSWNQINRPGACSLAYALMENERLKCLNLSFNGVSDEGALEIAFMLEQNTSLETLDLTENRITNRGAEFLASGLAKNSSLRSLDLSGNMMTSSGMESILVGVVSSGCIKQLHMKQISPNALCMKAIQHLKDKNVILSYGIPTLTKTNAFKGDKEVIVREEIFNEIRNFLTKERLRIIDLFKMWDKKKTGEISLDSLMSGLSSCGIPVTQAILEHIFGILDENQNNSLSYSEFLRIAKI